MFVSSILLNLEKVFLRVAPYLHRNSQQQKKNRVLKNKLWFCKILYIKVFKKKKESNFNMNSRNLKH